jgi:glycosyltransferase involved in cell wall biosynthesis
VTDGGTPLVSIVVPCYQQLELARECVDSILAQSFTDFELTLLDDGASDDYAAYVRSLDDDRVQYRRNVRRLGAMENMFQAIGLGRGRYVMAFHEDDLLSRGYLRAAVGALDENPRLAFVAAGLREFRGRPPASELTLTVERPTVTCFESAADFVRGILQGVEPMFGSVLYRRAALADSVARHDDYATLVDRPFLLSMLDRWHAAVIAEPLAWYRAAPEADSRHSAMRVEHILRLFHTYKTALGNPLDRRDEVLFQRYAGYWLFRLYDLTPSTGRPSLGRYLRRVAREGLYHPSGRGRFGLRLIARAVREALLPARS